MRLHASSLPNKTFLSSPSSPSGQDGVYIQKYNQTFSSVCVICSTVLVLIILYQRYLSNPAGDSLDMENSTVVVSLQAPGIKHTLRLKDVESEEEDYRILYDVGRQIRPALPPIKKKQKPANCHREPPDTFYYRRGLDTSVLREIDLGDSSG